MTTPFTEAAKTAVNLVPSMMLYAVVLIVVLTLINAISKSREGRNMSSDHKPVTEQAHRKLIESQITVIEEPDETRGLALRETNEAIELLRIEEKDGRYYRSSYFAVYKNEDIGQVADILSEYACIKESMVSE